MPPQLALGNRISTPEECHGWRLMHEDSRPIQDAEHNAARLEEFRKRSKTETPFFDDDEHIYSVSELLGARFDQEDEDRMQSIRFTTMLHLPWPAGDPIPWDEHGGRVPSTLARPKFFRSLIVSSPVDRTARRIACDAQTTPCPYCKRWFRNPSALALHITESHSANASVVSSVNAIGLAHEEKLEVEQVQRLCQIVESEVHNDHEWMRWIP